MSEKKIPLSPSEVKTALTKIMQDATVLAVASAFRDMILEGKPLTKDSPPPEGLSQVLTIAKQIADTFEYGDEFGETLKSTMSEFCDAMAKAAQTGDASDYLRMVRQYGNVSPASMQTMETMAREAAKRRHGAEGSA